MRGREGREITISLVVEVFVLKFGHVSLTITGVPIS